jgi:hypothetical protein
MLRMLGKLGDPALLTAAFPTQPEFLNYDSFLNSLVYQSRLNVNEGNAVYNTDGFPVYELTTTSEPISPLASSHDQTVGELAENFTEFLKADLADKEAHREHRMGSSIMNVGGWIVWPIPAWS